MLGLSEINQLVCNTHMTHHVCFLYALSAVKCLPPHAENASCFVARKQVDRLAKGERTTKVLIMILNVICTCITLHHYCKLQRLKISRNYMKWGQSQPFRIWEDALYYNYATYRHYTMSWLSVCLSCLHLSITWYYNIITDELCDILCIWVYTSPYMYSEIFLVRE